MPPFPEVIGAPAAETPRIAQASAALPMLLGRDARYVYGAAGRVSQIDSTDTHCPAAFSAPKMARGAAR